MTTTRTTTARPEGPAAPAVGRARPHHRFDLATPPEYDGHMEREVGIRELKDHASAVVDAVEAGASVVVTRRGRSVARLVPVGRDDTLRDELAARGIRWSGRRPQLPEPTPLKGAGPGAAEMVIADRGPR